STTYTLKGGWNSIYLHGDATHATPDELFAAYPEVLEVWRWNPNPNQVGFTTSPLIPSAGTAEWSTWLRDGSSNSLGQLDGQSAYLVKCSGTTSNSYSVSLPQRVLPPSAAWVRNGANLLGFPSYKNGSTYPTMGSYFATFPAAIAANVKIYKYTGGDLGAGNPLQVFSPTTEKLDRNQAYWFESAVVGNFYAPIEVTPSDSAGLDFGRTGSIMTVRLRNRSAATATVTVSTVASDAAPSSQTAITGSVPLTLRASDGTETPFSGAITQVVGPQSVVTMSFGINRGAMSADVDAFYASLLRFQDNGNLMDVIIPARASVASLAGLWVGEAEVSNVASKVASSPDSTTPRSFPLRFIIHVDESGTARLLSQVFMGALVGEGNLEGLCTREVGLKQDAKAGAHRMSVGHLPLDAVISAGSGGVALGETLVREITIGYTDPTNPFVHSYHPDHDNKDARPDGTVIPLSNGDESYTITRTCSFEFTSSPPDGTSPLGWGSTVIGGNYSEALGGLHKESIHVSGTFTLRRVSENGVLIIN
ncbi:MAG: hypothetical protein WEB53_15535, partial [Akkermansiaceae bacterium]